MNGSLVNLFKSTTAVCDLLVYICVGININL